MSFSLKDLQFGELNNIKDNDENPSGDRRRTTTSSALRMAAEKAFEINTLATISEVVGIVVGSRRISKPISEYKATIVGLQQEVADDTESSNDETQRYLYKVYVPELEPLPAPLSLEDPVIGLYADVALAEGAVGGTSPAELNGSIVEVAYDDLANLNGPRITRIIAQGAISIPATMEEGAAQLFANSTPIALGAGAGQTNFTTPSRSEVKNKKFTWQERGVLYDALKPLFAYIAKGEGKPNSVNRGVAGDTPLKKSPKGSLYTDNIALTDRTLDQVKELYKGGSLASRVKLYSKENTPDGVRRRYQNEEFTPAVMRSVSTPGLVAAGKFQWIRGTFRATIQAAGLSSQELSTLKFNERNQEVLATYLILNKRSRLGAYLLGLHDNVADAGQELAQEFSSVPNQWEAPHGSGKPWRCPRGYNHYCSDPKPGSKQGANGSFKPTLKKPDGVAQKLREAREAIRKNPKALAIAKTIATSAFT